MNKPSDKIALIVCWIGVCITIIAIIFGITSAVDDHNRKVEQDRKALAWYQTNYLTKSGSTTLWKGSNGEFLNYNLHSFDGGKIWYAAHNTTNGLEIVGKADDVYPGLVSTLDGWDAVFEYARTNGPISFSDQHGLEILNKAGITIKKVE